MTERPGRAARIFAPLLALLLALSCGPAGAQQRLTPPPLPPARPALPAPVLAPRPLALDLNKSQVVRLNRPARDVLVANPGIADVLLRSPDTAFVIAKKVGETNVYFLDADGRQIDAVDINVAFDSAAVAQALKRAIPAEQIEVSTANQSIVLTGAVGSQQTADNAQQVARQFVTDDRAIVNLLSVRDKNQVVLRVRVTEMQRTTLKELGITPGFPAPLNFTIGGLGLTFAGTPATFLQAPLYGLATGPGSNPLATAATAPSSSFNALLQALESNGLVKTLAEPTLAAVSGETASFLVGGKFPLPTVVGIGTSAQVVPTFYPFGVQLTFTPVVLSSGLISLKIATSVSATSTPTNVGGTSVPSLTERGATLLW